MRFLLGARDQKVSDQLEVNNAAGHLVSNGH